MPITKHLFCMLHHNPSIALYTFLMKSWLYKAALLPVSFAINGQQAITNQLAQPLRSLAAGKVARILCQYIAYVFRSKKEHDRNIADADCCHVAVSLLQALQIPELITPEIEDISYQWQRSGARWESCILMNCCGHMSCYLSWKNETPENGY